MRPHTVVRTDEADHPLAAEAAEACDENTIGVVAILGSTMDGSHEPVASINTSGHRYGLVYPGIGWVMWRDQEALPQELVERVAYGR